MRAFNIIAALLAPGAGHVRAGRLRRGILWIAVLLVSLPTVRWTPFLPALLWLAHVVDAGIIEEGDTPNPLAALGLGAAAYVLLVGGALVTKAYWAEMFKNPSGSMVPALLVGDHFAVDKTVRHPQRGDVIVFVAPNDPAKDLVKRVIAVGGDTVEGRDGDVLVDGNPIARPGGEESFTYDDFDVDTGVHQNTCKLAHEHLDAHDYAVVHCLDAAGPPGSFARVVVPPGAYYVLGDNRENSFDSRHFGTVPERNIKGRATYVWWSTANGPLQRRIR